MAALAFVLAMIALIICSFFITPLMGWGAYLLSFFIHPPSRWWGVILPDVRWALISGTLALLAAIKYKSVLSKNPWYKDSIIGWYGVFLLWMWMQTPWALSMDSHLQGVTIMTKYMLVMYLIVKIGDSTKAIEIISLMYVIGCAYLGILARSVGASSDRLDGVGGPGIDDANTLGMYLACGSVVAISQCVSGTIWKRSIFFIGLLFSFNGLILTQSRGAFLGLAAGCAFIIFSIDVKKRSMLLGLLMIFVAIFISISTKEFWERMSTIQVSAEHSREKSAESRLVIASAQLRMFAEHPMGVGHRGTAALSRQYIPEEYLAKEVGVPKGNRQRSSHNTFLTILVEQGIIGFVLYAFLLKSVFRRLYKLSYLSRSDASNTGLFLIFPGIGGALISILVAGQFTDYLRAENLAWFYALIVAIYRIISAEKTKNT